MHRVALIVGALCATIGATPIQPGARFDFSGVDAFWTAYESLRNGSEPPRSAWNAIFDTPGYAALEAREHRRAGLEQAIRLAFHPARMAERDSALKTSGFTARSLRHLMGIPAARDSIAQFRSLLDRSSVLDAARQRVSGFLPPGLADSITPPPVALVFFLDDGRGYPGVIVADLLRLARAGSDTGYFAHEFYHAYRRHFAARYADHRAADVGLEELLAYPVEEGMADQLDKRAYAELGDAEFFQFMRRPGAPGYAPEYRAAYSQPARWMAMVSRALERGAAAPDSANLFARAVRDSLPDSGRALGAWMARVVDRVLGRDVVVRAGADQYLLWLEYDRAAVAGQPGAPRLSPKAIAVVRRLASEYRLPG